MKSAVAITQNEQLVQDRVNAEKEYDMLIKSAEQERQHSQLEISDQDTKAKELLKHTQQKYK